MLRKSLKTILNEQIDLYLSEDNPVRETGFQKFVGLFNSSGAEGRLRALSYKQNVVNNAAYSGEDGEFRLKNDVWFHLSKATSTDQNSLDTSEKLRLRLLAGLCEYLGVTDAEIARARQLLIRACVSAHTGYVAGNHMEIQARLSVLRAKMEAPVVEMTDRVSPLKMSQ